jgi:hypothetical protein
MGHPRNRLEVILDELKIFSSKLSFFEVPRCQKQVKKFTRS